MAWSVDTFPFDIFNVYKYSSGFLRKVDLSRLVSIKWHHIKASTYRYMTSRIELPLIPQS